MEEKTIIKSELSSPVALGIIIGLLAAIVLWFVPTALFGTHYNLVLIIALVIGIIIAIVFSTTFSKTNMTVTDKRIYGSVKGKRVDLPLDSVSAVGTTFLKGISVSTASGVIKFKFIKNRDEIHKAISDLLIERQGKVKTETTIKQEIQQSSADELAKFKDLLDKGVISQEEFDAKKKQLLGL